MMIPEWMKEVEIGSCECSAISHGKKSFVGKTINGILGFMEEAFVSESFSKRNGLLQSLDPRAKLVSILVLVFTTTLIGDLRLLILVYMVTLLFSHLSKSEKVHKAMMSRGYNGEVKIMQEFKMRNRDYISVVIALSMCVVLVLISQNIIG